MDVFLVILNWIILGRGAALDIVGCLQHLWPLPVSFNHTFPVVETKTGPEGRRGKLSLMELHTVKEVLFFVGFFFLTLTFYLHLANTQNYLEEITSYDGPLQNPQK